MKYEVTIGIPVFRAVGYIEHTMASALCQTFPSIEYLVIDDCGDDGSIDVVERLMVEHPRGKDIRIIKNFRNLGVGVTRNRILDEAQGRYLYFLDSDDLIEPDTIQLLIDKMKQNQSEIVYGSMDRIDCIGNSPTQAFVLPDLLLLSEHDMAIYAFKNYNTFQISVCNCLIDLEFLRNTQLRFIEANYWEDLVFTYEIVMRVRHAVLVSEVTYHYLCRPGSLSHYQSRELLEKDEIMENISMMGYLKGKCPLLKGRPYLPYLCYNLEMNSFYSVCHVIKNAGHISPPITGSELRHFMNYPLSFFDIIHFRKKCLQNIILWFVSHLPVPFFITSIKLMGSVKRIL